MSANDTARAGRILFYWLPPRDWAPKRAERGCEHAIESIVSGRILYEHGWVLEEVNP